MFDWGKQHGTNCHDHFSTITGITGALCIIAYLSHNHAKNSLKLLVLSATVGAIA